MKRTSRFAAMSGGVLACLLLTACGGGGAPADAETPEGQAFIERDAIMELLRIKMATIGGMSREEIPLDEEVFARDAADLAALAGMIAPAFEEELISSNSRSLPDIWSNWDDFSQKATDLVNAAQGLAEAAEYSGFGGAQALVQGTAGTCGACHRPYRARVE